MTSEKLLFGAGIPNLTEWRNFSTSEFEHNRGEIRENSEYQSHREFHELSKEGENSELQYWTKKPYRAEVDGILEI
jgi:hypothetical protein